jgi:hypothetical protein
LSESLIEITHSKQQNGIRVFGFDGFVLLHQRCIGCLLFAHGEATKINYNNPFSSPNPYLLHQLLPS